MKNIDLGLNRYICCQYGVTIEFDLDTFDILKETYFDGIYNDIIVIYDYKTKRKLIRFPCLIHLLACKKSE
jgi:hypothetical protein